jgi:WS/DGAT/MGAT family acyltransferase
MKQLSGLDASFLYLETPETPMHVGSLNVYELPKGFRGDFCERVRSHIGARLHRARVLTHKLADMPLDLSNPVWVEDPDIDLEYHVRRVELPRPGTHTELEDYVARLHSTLMDRNRPLWEFYVIEGLADGHVGFYSKVHHAAVDGQAGVALATAILDLSPEPRPVEAATHSEEPSHAIGAAEMVSAALASQMAQYGHLARALPTAAKSVLRSAAGAIARRLGRGEPADESAPRNWKLGPKTPLNVSISRTRAIATASLPLAGVREIGKAHGASVNDVVLALCSGALRRYLIDRQALPAKSLTAAVPVSLRAAGDATANTQATMVPIDLGTQLDDPAQRLDSVIAASAAMKLSLGKFRSIIPTDFPSIGAPWVISGLASLYARTHLADRLPPFANVVISNVPGPQFPLYLAGARMLSYYPLSIIMHGMALNITLESYNGSLDFGLVGCRHAVPGLRDLARYLREEYAILQALEGAANMPAPATAKAPARPTRSKAKGAAASGSTPAPAGVRRRTVAGEAATARKAAAPGKSAKAAKAGKAAVPRKTPRSGQSSAADTDKPPATRATRAVRTAPAGSPPRRARKAARG